MAFLSETQLETALLEQLPGCAPPNRRHAVWTQTL